jgi:CubicO group peptidase (beta-lactamase class C family)
MERFWEGLDETVQAMQAEWGVPGVSLAIVKDDETVYARGFGEREHGKDGAVDAQSLFAIGSCTKAFTATAIAMLVQERKLAWDDPVTQYLPDFQLYDPLDTREIRVRDLLCHRSGLPTFAGDFMNYGSNYSSQEVLRRIRFIPPGFRLRAGYGYSNLMYLAAGMIIPAVAGVSWEAFVRQRLIEPLGMQRTLIGPRRLPKTDNVAQPHTFFKGELAQVPYANLEADMPAGAINSCAWDMSLWLRFQLSGGKAGDAHLIDPAILEETHTPHTLEPIEPDQRPLVPRRHFSTYGLGWNLSDYGGQLVVSHTGGVDGMLSMAGFLPEEGLGVVILTNRYPGSLYKALFYNILDAALGFHDRDWQAVYRAFDRKNEARQAEARQKLEEGRLKGTRPSLPLESYQGGYTNTIYGSLTVSLEDGRLMLRPGAHPHLYGPLEHWHLDTFYCPWSTPTYEDSFVRFSVGLDGQVESLRFKVAEFIDPLEYMFVREKE